MIRRSLLVCAFPVVAVALWAPSAVNAAIHSGSASFAEPATPPSIGEPQPPEDQRSEYDREVAVHYDPSAGSLTLELEAWDATYWGQKIDEDVTVGQTCDSPELEGTVEARPAGNVANEEGEQGAPASTGRVSGHVTLAGYEGEVQGTGAFNGQRFVFTFMDPAFRDREWKCVGLGSGSSFTLGGWPSLSARSDTDALLTKIGHAVPPQEQATVCPAVEILSGHAGCIAEYFADGRWHTVVASVTVQGEGYGVRIYYTRSWTRHWRRSPASCLRDWHATGYLESNDGACDAKMASDLEFELRDHRVPKHAYTGGTDTAGYSAILVYDCRSSGGTTECSNAVGDAFRYRP